VLQEHFDVKPDLVAFGKKIQVAASSPVLDSMK
jgi:4-aminobutyrate aminotransferase-like enzyme